MEHLASNGYYDANIPDITIRPEKVVSETSILLVAASSAAAHPEIGTRINHLAQRLIPHARCERMALGLCMEPFVAWDYALPHVCLTRLGYRDSAFDGLLRKSLNSQASAGRERVPHRTLEQEWAAAAWSEPKSRRRPIASRTARRSILNHPMDLVNGARDDIYAFTHALMYVTDFNLRPAPLPRRRSVILAEAEAALTRCLDDQDYDLAGEVLLSWPLTGTSWSATAAFGFRVLTRVEDKATFLPTPNTRIGELKALEGIRRTQYLLATAYHTAYVMGLLCAASLVPGCSPPAAIQYREAKSGSAMRIMKLLACDDRRPHWYGEIEQLGAPEMDALAGFLINVALRRRTAARDFQGVREILALAYHLDLAEMPAASQAAEMLDRLATFAEITNRNEEASVSRMRVQAA
uniref:DUF6895 domain-containing protein n=1 Tax=uncultured Acidobacteriota bacterium TaxID=171953 RepID=F2YWV8_9BACT|nr:hypothetical protein Lip018_ORF007 [uncultured Acidobacteriota bacterium]